MHCLFVIQLWIKFYSNINNFNHFSSCLLNELQRTHKLEYWILNLWIIENQNCVACADMSFLPAFPYSCWLPMDCIYIVYEYSILYSFLNHSCFVINRWGNEIERAILIFQRCKNYVLSRFCNLPQNCPRKNSSIINISLDFHNLKLTERQNTHVVPYFGYSSKLNMQKNQPNFVFSGNFITQMWFDI